jgi:hypothetical protein
MIAEHSICMESDSASLQNGPFSFVATDQCADESLLNNNKQQTILRVAAYGGMHQRHSRCALPSGPPKKFNTAMCVGRIVTPRCALAVSLISDGPKLLHHVVRT